MVSFRHATVLACTGADPVYDATVVVEGAVIKDVPTGGVGPPGLAVRWSTAAGAQQCMPGAAEGPLARRLYPLARVAAAEFGVGRDGQETGVGCGVLPFLSVGHALAEDPFSLLIVIMQGLIAGGQGLVPPGTVLIAGLTGGGSFGVGAEGAQGSVEGAEPGQAQFLSDVAGCPGSLGGVGVAEQPQPPVRHGTDAGPGPKARNASCQAAR